ncbi:hypothetical protein BgAZ_104040 [Babesia gibsoni]|uniref:Tubulin-specific chaperone A n=1 Tax=Babesia gibsoni TaxID=33632 RepID=A0AAD8PFV5_BABGI|nr:hypothetical protein BgAZ_104040 [Babesia gibsoni]
MTDRVDVLLGAMKRLQRDLHYYNKELDKLNAHFSDDMDEADQKKMKEMIEETKSTMQATRQKMDIYAKELTDLGVSVDP